MNSVVQSTAVKYGLIAAAINVGWLLLAYLVDLSLFVNPWAGVALWLVGIVIFILAVVKVRSTLEGYISFKEAFSTFILSYLINAAIAMIFAVLLFNFIDPAAAEEIQELTIERSVEMFENFGMADDEIDAAIEKMENQNSFSLGNQLRGLLMGIAFYAIVGLIVAAVMKKNPPETYEA